MTYETKKQQRERFLAEFLRRLREAPEGRSSMCLDHYGLTDRRRPETH
jgi:hypothetical protein